MPAWRSPQPLRSRDLALIRSLWPIAFMAALFALSSVPGSNDPDAAGRTLPAGLAWVSPAVQNSLHLPAFAVLAWLWFRCLRPIASLWIVLTLGLGLTLAYGAVDEWRQAYIPGRYPAATDLVVDAIGAAIAALAYGLRDGRGNV